MSDKKYVGRGKQVGNYDLVNFSIAESKVAESWYEYNGERYLKMTIGKLKQPDNYGKTHSVWIDEYKPQENGTAAPKKAVATEGSSDLPF
jgi:hypothetical protein